MSSSLTHDSASATNTTTEEIVPPDVAAKASSSSGGTLEDVPRDEMVVEEEQGSLAMGHVASMGSRQSQPVVDSSPRSSEPATNKPTVSLKKKSKMEALEIEIIEGNATSADDNIIIIENDDSPPNTIPMNKSQDEFDDDLDRVNADMEGLLASSSSNGNNRNKNIKSSSSKTKRFQTKRVTRRPKTSSSCCTDAKCCINNNLERHGNCVVFCPRVFSKTGWGIMGPHWFGPPCCAAVILFASSYFIRHSLTRIGPITSGICTMFTVINIYLLMNTCYRNPGIVMPASDDGSAPSAQHRW
jgi:hypothetical protein